MPVKISTKTENGIAVIRVDGEVVMMSSATD